MSACVPLPRAWGLLVIKVLNYLSKKKKKKSAKALVFITWSPLGTLCILPVCMCCTPFRWVLLLIKYFLLIKKKCH